MHDLIRKVARNTGINEEKAKTAVETVLAHLRSRMPVTVSGYVDEALRDGEATGGRGPGRPQTWRFGKQLRKAG